MVVELSVKTVLLDENVDLLHQLEETSQQQWHIWVDEHDLEGKNIHAQKAQRLSWILVVSAGQVYSKR
jgi:hypothetical protein